MGLILQVLYKSIDVACPQCGEEKVIRVPEQLFSRKKYGHIKVQVPQGAVCQNHVFVVFLDIEGRILGYEKIDLSISSSIEGTHKEDSYVEDLDQINLQTFIDILGFRCVSGLIHAKLFNYPLYLIIEEKDKVNLDYINKVLDEIMPDVYKNTRSLKIVRYSSYVFPTVSYFYTLVKNQRKSAFLMNPKKHIVQMPWNTGLELEKSIINTVLNAKRQNNHIKNLNYYITKFLEDVDQTLSILKTVNKISKKDLTKKLTESSLTSTITKDRVNAIKEFIYRRFSPDLSKKIKD